VEIVAVMVGTVAVVMQKFPARLNYLPGIMIHQLRLMMLLQDRRLLLRRLMM